MKITSNEIRKQISLIWQNCYTLNTDKKFILPTFNELKKIVKETEVVKIQNLSQSDSCDDISIILWGKVKEIRNKMKQEGQISDELSWPLGICFGTVFNGWPSPHWQNLCFTTDGIYMLEGQTGDFWRPSFPDDSVFFVLI
jgi:hypothetical protein